MFYPCPFCHDPNDSPNTPGTGLGDPDLSNDEKCEECYGSGIVDYASYGFQPISKLEESRRRLQQKLKEIRGKKKGPSDLTPVPRYDEVYEKGMKWLNGDHGFEFSSLGSDDEEHW